MRQILKIALVLIVYQTKFSLCDSDDYEIFGDNSTPDYSGLFDTGDDAIDTTTTVTTTTGKPATTETTTTRKSTTTTATTTRRTTTRRVDPTPVVPQKPRVTDGDSDWEDPEVMNSFKNATYL
jgi:hypothetical protein